MDFSWLFLGRRSQRIFREAIGSPRGGRRTRSGIAGSDIGAASGRRLYAPFGCASASPRDESSPAATRQRGGTRAMRRGAARRQSQALFRSCFIEPPAWSPRVADASSEGDWRPLLFDVVTRCSVPPDAVSGLLWLVPGTLLLLRTESATRAPSCR